MTKCVKFITQAEHVPHRRKTGAGRNAPYARGCAYAGCKPGKSIRKAARRARPPIQGKRARCCVGGQKPESAMTMTEKKKKTTVEKAAGAASLVTVHKTAKSENTIEDAKALFESLRRKTFRLHFFAEEVKARRWKNGECTLTIKGVVNNDELEKVKTVFSESGDHKVPESRKNDWKGITGSTLVSFKLPVNALPKNPEDVKTLAGIFGPGKFDVYVSPSDKVMWTIDTTNLYIKLQELDDKEVLVKTLQHVSIRSIDVFDETLDPVSIIDLAREFYETPKKAGENPVGTDKDKLD